MTDTSIVPVPPSAMTHGERASSAQAEQAKSLVLAQYTMAARFPRNWLDVRSSLLAECSRPRFAEKARYSIPFKKREKNEQTGRWEDVTVHVIGFSIRFAEAAARLLKNILIQTPTVHDDDDKSIVKVMVFDLEANVAWSKDVTVEKVVERKKLKEGQRPIRQRANSWGDTVYLVPATAQEVRRNIEAEISKAVRTCILRLVPGDILEECEEKIIAVLAQSDKSDPQAATKRIVDGFAKLGVKASDLEELLGHSLDGVIPDEIVRLRGYYEAMRDGAATWPQIVEIETGEEPKNEKEDPMAETRKAVQERVHKSRAKSKKAEPKSDPKAEAPKPDEQPAVSLEVEAMMKAQNCDAEEASKLIGEGWEIDPKTGDAIPPAGAGG